MKTIKDLKGNQRNPRKMSSDKLRMLKKSLEEFGDLSGIVYNKKLDRLVGGHQRKKSVPEDAEIVIEKEYSPATPAGTVAEGFVKLGTEKMRYREVDWDEPKDFAANIAANKHSGDWDIPVLNEILLDLDAENYDMDLTGFSDLELEDLLAPISESGLIEDDEIPEEVDPNAKLGQIYQLGEHRLMCGDSTDEETVLKLMSGEKANMVFTDPPYGISESGDRSKRNGVNSLKSGVVYKDFKDDSTKYAIDAFNLCQKINIEIQVWFGANYYCHSLPETNNWLVWDKRIEDKQRDFNSDCELAWVSNGKNSTRIFRHLWKGLIKGSEHGKARVHPTQKPIALAEWCFEEYGKPKSVLDLFGGSGSTLIACEKTNRKCFMMELDPHYVDVIIARWEKFTGKRAELING